MILTQGFKLSANPGNCKQRSLSTEQNRATDMLKYLDLLLGVSLIALKISLNIYQPLHISNSSKCSTKSKLELMCYKLPRLFSLLKGIQIDYRAQNHKIVSFQVAAPFAILCTQETYQWLIELVMWLSRKLSRQVLKPTANTLEHNSPCGWVGRNDKFNSKKIFDVSECFYSIRRELSDPNF